GAVRKGPGVEIGSFLGAIVVPDADHVLGHVCLPGFVDEVSPLVNRRSEDEPAPRKPTTSTEISKRLIDQFVPHGLRQLRTRHFKRQLLASVCSQFYLVN